MCCIIAALIGDYASSSQVRTEIPTWRCSSASTPTVASIARIDTSQRRVNSGRKKHQRTTGLQQLGYFDATSTSTETTVVTHLHHYQYVGVVVVVVVGVDVGVAAAVDVAVFRVFNK